MSSIQDIRERDEDARSIMDGEPCAKLLGVIEGQQAGKDRHTLLAEIDIWSDAAQQAGVELAEQLQLNIKLKAEIDRLRGDIQTTIGEKAWMLRLFLAANKRKREAQTEAQDVYFDMNKVCGELDTENIALKAERDAMEKALLKIDATDAGRCGECRCDECYEMKAAARRGLGEP